MNKDQSTPKPRANIQRRIHDWFGLSYGNYAIFQRSILQSMPDEWQDKFVGLLDELEEKVLKELHDMPSGYFVRARDDFGKFVKDPYADYERGRRNVFSKK